MKLYYIVNLAYLIASVLFIFGLKGLTHPRTAVRGNLFGSLGMLMAIVAVTISISDKISPVLLIVGLVVGGAIGAIAAVKVQMTAMPQMVALFNGFGGIASVLVAGGAYVSLAPAFESPLQMSIATAASCLIGAVTFTGSLIAFAKLQGLKFISSGQILFNGQKAVNLLTAIVSVGLCLALVLAPEATWLYWVLAFAAFALGVLLVIPIGGADMPVVISLLNSYSGLAAAATGFVINNNVLIIAGSLVGASGLILTSIMCKAMNRSLTNVLFGVLGPAEGAASADDVYAGKVKAAGPEEVAMLFDTARRAVVVPGYGMAVAQAQHIVRDMANILEQRGCTVEYAIHPVAGRMPGHMNVLLAEADVPYDKLIEMDTINPEMDRSTWPWSSGPTTW